MQDHDCKYRDDIILTKQSVKNMQDDIKDIKKTLTDFIKGADDKYARRSDLVFWRNTIVGVIASTVMLIIAEIISVIYK